MKNQWNLNEELMNSSPKWLVCHNVQFDRMGDYSCWHIDYNVHFDVIAHNSMCNPYYAVRNIRHNDMSIYYREKISTSISADKI